MISLCAVGSGVSSAVKIDYSEEGGLCEPQPPRKTARMIKHSGLRLHAACRAYPDPGLLPIHPCSVARGEAPKVV